LAQAQDTELRDAMIAAGATVASSAGVAGALDASGGGQENGAQAVSAPADGANSAKGAGPAKLPLQDKAEQFYNSNAIQIAVAFLIGANFLTNIVEKQIDPAGTIYDVEFAAFDLCYNILFTIELLVNLYAHWFLAFWSSSWNIFDTVVVTIGVINMVNLPLPKAFSLLRMMRAFRVFRLFKRVKSLNKIIVAIMHAIPGVMNAFLILTIIMCIYAILGIEFFQDVGKDCAHDTNTTYLSIREFCTGEEYFGSFSKSIYSFFQILTGESWSEMIARPVIWSFHDDWHLAVGAALYFVSFVIVSSFILTNVVVAVLLDKMSAAEGEAAEEATQGDGAITDSETQPPVTPLSDREGIIFRQSVQIQSSLDKLAAKNNTVRTEFDDMKKDMALMRDQIAAIAEMVEQSPCNEAILPTQMRL